jgi:hypothetical protein
MIIDKELFYKQSLERLAQLNAYQSHSPANHPFPYTDIEKYSQYVENYLDHVEMIEEKFFNYKDAQGNRERQIALINEGIERADTFKAHLQGGKDENGSLEFKKDKARKIKNAIAEFEDQLETGYRELQAMPNSLQEEINKKIAEQNKLKISDILTFISMSLSVAGALQGVAVSFKKILDRNKTRLNSITQDISNKWTSQDWGQKGFDTFKSEIKREYYSTYKIGSEEIDLVGNKTIALVQAGLTTALKVELYKERQKSAKKIGEHKVDKLDVEAAVLPSEKQRLELKMQRNAFKAFIHEFLDQFKAARTWRQKISDYFDTGEARFDALDHLSKLQAEIRSLEFKVSMFERDKRLLEEKMAAEKFQPNQDAVNLALETNYRLAIRAALDKIVDEARAYRIWTLAPYDLPEIPANMSVNLLRDRFHNPLWERITEQLLKEHKPAEEDFGPRHPFIWNKDDYPDAFAQLRRGEWVRLNLPLNLGNEIYHQQLTQVRIFLKGANLMSNSPVRFLLRHPGHCTQLVRKLLFSLDPEKFNLNDRRSKWKERFKNELSLSKEAPIFDSATIIERVPQEVWLLNDDGRVLSIRLEKGLLNVYERQSVSYYLEDRTFEGSYMIKNGEPEYDHEGAIHQDVMDTWTEIGYSPFTMWELKITPNYREGDFNKDIDWDGLTEIQLRYSAFRKSFDTS